VEYAIQPEKKKKTDCNPSPLIVHHQ